MRSSVHVPDVNVLFALLHRDHPHHAAAAAWWADAADNATPISVLETVWTGTMRLLTNSRVLEAPLAPLDALTLLGRLTDEPGVQYAVTPAVARDVLVAMAHDGEITHRTVTDGWIAAQARAMGATVVTFDRDFRRFEALRLNLLPVS